MLIKLIVYVLLISQLLSCKKREDPLIGFVLGSEEKVWSNHLGKLESEGILLKDEYSNYRSFLIIEEDSIPSEYSFNNPNWKYDLSIYNTDYYSSSELINISIDLRGDSICNLALKSQGLIKNEYTIINNFGPIRKFVIDKTKKFLINCYGPPDISADALINGYFKDLQELGSRKSNNIFEIIRANSEIEKKYGINSHPKAERSKNSKYFTDIWDKGSYKILFCRERYYYDECFSDTIYNSASIIYLVKNYENKLIQIQESIKKNLSPNDYFELHFEKPQITYFNTNYIKLIQPIHMVSRDAPEDVREITDIKFDIIYFNKFNEELFTIENCVYEFTNPLEIGCAESFHFQKPSYEFVLTRNNESENLLINLTSNYYYNLNPKKSMVRALIRKIVFDDGTVVE